MEPLRNYLARQPLLFDGAMGTYYALQHGISDAPCEYGNLLHPDVVEAIHLAYVDAGASAIKTNTFSANRLNYGEDCAPILRAGFDLACRAAGDSAYVFADIGPVLTSDPDAAAEEYRFLADQFLSFGAHYYLFETNSTLAGIPQTARHIREIDPEAFIICSFSAQADGFTTGGSLAQDLITQAADSGAFDAVGLNCVIGAYHMAKLAESLSLPSSLLFSAMPNAGYPTVRGKRTRYDGNPDYFALQLSAIQELGARILGGCCGTTPEHIRAAASALSCAVSAPKVRVRPETAQDRPAPESDFFQALEDPGRRPFAVELDPPAGADLSKFTAGAAELRDAGVSILTIADCPIARPRMDSSILACKIRRELHMDTMPHLTCRDRNLNATQALLYGLHAEGVRNVLAVTGDPIPSAMRDEVKSVYNFNSRKLIAYISSLNSSALPSPLRIFGALNVNAVNFRMQLHLAEEKERSGACGFLTQPVLSPQAAENLRMARSVLKGKLLGGIMPIVSHRNALFMNSEVSGISVDDAIIAAYEGADREKGEALALEISLRFAEEIAPYVDGFYLITPFGRTALIASIVEAIRSAGLA